MTDINFGYRYDITIANPLQVTQYVIPINLTKPELISEAKTGFSPQGRILDSGDYLDYNTIPESAYNIDGRRANSLQMKFKISQSQKQGAASYLELTNLPKEVINNIRRDSFVLIRAGYSTNNGDDLVTVGGQEGNIELPVIFSGQVANHSTENDTVDTITKIVLGDAVTLQRNSRFSRSFPPNTTREQVIRGIVRVLVDQGMPLGRIVEPPNGSKQYRVWKSPYFSGYSTKGYTMSTLEELCSSVGLYVYIVLGRIYIEPETITPDAVSPLALSPEITYPKKSSIVVLIPESIKGKVEPSDSDSSATPSSSSNKGNTKSLSLTAYLDAELSVNKLIELKGFENTIDGEYKLTSVVHEMDYRGNLAESLLTIKSL